MYKGLWLMLLMLISACVSVDNESYSSYLQQWVGQTEYRLYNTWGLPDKMFYLTPDKKLVTYLSVYSHGNKYPYTDELHYDGMGNNGGLWSRFFGPPAEQQADIYYCKTSFVIQNAVVTNYNFNGDNCVVRN